MLIDLDTAPAVGPVRLGMEYDRVEAALRHFGSPSWMCMGGAWTVYRSSGLSITPRRGHDNRRIESIRFEGTLWDDAAEPDSLRFRGIDLLTLPWREVVDRLAAHLPVTEEERMFTVEAAPGVELSLILPWDEEDPRMFDQVVVSFADA
jgi:hypothetical protein